MSVRFNIGNKWVNGTYAPDRGCRQGVVLITVEAAQNYGKGGYSTPKIGALTTGVP
jgi:hypothetical protein